MGREWYWSGRSSRRGRRNVEVEENDATSGCMCAVFQLFDLHQFQLPLNQQRPPFKANISLPQEANVLKDVEAPRNSLESDEVSLSSMIVKEEEEEEKFKIPMGIQIKTSGASHDMSNSSETSCSPGPKTPNLVARLMGLDIIPDSQSSSTSTTPNFTAKYSNLQNIKPRQQHLHCRPRNSTDNRDVSGTRSLPETPRISSARRSDVDHHRLSLQINKENINEEFESSRLAYLGRKELKCEDDTRSPRHYAKQIVKQVKNSVSRRVGLDITNTVRNRDSAREDLVNQIKSKKLSKNFVKVGEDISPGRLSSSSSSCSPRLRFLDTKNKQLKTTSSSSCPKDQKVITPSNASENYNLHHNNTVSLKVKPQLKEESTQIKCKKIAGEKFNLRLKKPPQTSDIIRNKQEEPFVRPSSFSRANSQDKKCKKTPLSDHILNISVPTLVPVKKESPSLRAIKLLQQQESDAQESKSWSQLSSCSSHLCNKQDSRNNTEDTTAITTRDDDKAARAALSAEYYQYIIRILKRAGVNKDTKVSLTSWHSPSHPLDPSIFHCLELYSYHQNSRLSLRCNRKLIFHLVDESLVDILKPLFNIKPWIKVGPIDDMKGSHLIKKLCSSVEKFPEADCNVLEDIDTLIDMDLHGQKHQLSIAYEDSAEGIVSEIEKDIVESLIHEAIAEWAFRW